MARVSALLAAAVALMVLGGTVAALAASGTTTTSTTAPGATTAAGTTATTTGTTTGAKGAVINLSGRGQVAFVVLVIGVLALIWFGLIAYDRISANKRLKAVLEVVLPNVQGTSLSVDQLTALVKVARPAPRGARGLTRTTIALALVTLVGVALTALLVGQGNNASDLLKSVVTALTAALTTVVGFYFGAKTATDAAAAGSGGTTSAARTAPKLPGAPTINSVTPGEGSVTVEFAPPADVGDSPIIDYTVSVYEVGKTEPEKTETGAVSPITVRDLVGGVAYSVTVSARSAAGRGVESERSKDVKPTTAPSAGH